MIEGFPEMALWQKWLIAYGALTLRYIIFAGSLYLLFYVWKKRSWLHKKIQQKFPEPKRVWFEIKYSFATFAVFASFVCINFYFASKGWNQIYRDFNDHSIAYFLFSIVVFIIVHDTYFYWTHRFMHLPGVFERIHKVHHMSNNPTPFAAFSFHPLEAVIEFSIIFLITFIMPVHRYAIFVFAIYMIANNVLGHLGFEVYPKGFTKNKLTSWLNTSTNHNMHHKFVNCNYGLYFSIWDRLMKTNHAKYHETFDAVAGKKAATKIESEETLATA